MQFFPPKEGDTYNFFSRKNNLQNQSKATIMKMKNRSLKRAFAMGNRLRDLKIFTRVKCERLC